MSTNLSTQKTMLAKLLAGENLSVVHKRGLTTAMIDLKTRTLYLPVWEDMTSELYDLLGGHEVGHALFTPQAGWHSETHDESGKFLGSFKDVLNVCEDARIEKLIKRKYPGLSKSFVEGYKILHGRDFFGIKRLRDFSKMNIIDRINIYAKCGSFLIVPFNDEERVLVREAESTETWEQVVELARKLHDRAKQEQDQKMNSLADLTEELLKQFEEDEGSLDLSDEDDSDDDSDDDSEDDQMSKNASEDESNDEDSDTSDEGSESNDEDSDKDEESEGDGEGDADDESEDGDDSEEDGDAAGQDGGESAEDADDEPKSITDRIFRNRERELLTDGLEVYTYNLPKPMLDRIIVPHKIFAENFFEILDKTQKQYGRNDPIAATCSTKFNERNRQYINLLVKEFEMRKNARQYARTEIAKSGELDMSKLHKYRFSNDLFSRIKIVPKGKSHGMMMFVDMSGSMSSCFASTMEQTLALVAFCRKVNIPFDVYGFSDRADYPMYLQRMKKISTNFVGSKFQKMNNDAYAISDAGFHLVHMISSRLTGNSYRRAFEIMSIVAMNWKNSMYSRTCLPWEQMGFSLGGTPFTQTLMASRPMIEKFKQETDTDIVNVIYLTDGDGTGCFTFTEVKSSPINPETGKPRITNKVFLVDPKTKKRVELSVRNCYYGDDTSQQTAMTLFVREVTGCKHIGFYVADTHSVRAKIRSIKSEMSPDEEKALEKFWRENEYYSASNIGYDMYYYVKSRAGSADDGKYNLSEDMTTKKIAKVFSEAQFDKRRHRVMVSKFAQEIAA